MSAASFGRRIAVPFALSTASVVLTLGAIEVWLRLTTPPPAIAPSGTPVPQGVPVLRSMAELVEPNADGVMYNGVPYRTNASGFRGRDYARPKPPGVFRIVMLGDSFTMGAGVAEADTYAARVERALNEPPGPVTYEVLNLGVAGYNAWMVAHRLERLGLSFQPDLIFYGYTMNDIEGPSYRSSIDAANRLIGDMSREEERRTGLLVTTFFRTRLYSLRELVWPPRGSYVWELDDNYFHNDAALARVDGAFAGIEAAARKRGACVALMQHTYLWFLHAFHPFRRHYAVVAALAVRHGFTTADTLDYFVGHGGTQLWVSPFDPHPNAAGHAILARAALDLLREVPASCWGAAGPPEAIDSSAGRRTVDPP